MFWDLNVIFQSQLRCSQFGITHTKPCFKNLDWNETNSGIIYFMKKSKSSVLGNLKNKLYYTRLSIYV